MSPHDRRAWLVAAALLAGACGTPASSSATPPAGATGETRPAPAAPGAAWTGVALAPTRVAAELVDASELGPDPITARWSGDGWLVLRRMEEASTVVHRSGGRETLVLEGEHVTLLVADGAIWIAEDAGLSPWAAGRLSERRACPRPLYVAGTTETFVVGRSPEERSELRRVTPTGCELLHTGPEGTDAVGLTMRGGAPVVAVRRRADPRALSTSEAARTALDLSRGDGRSAAAAFGSLRGALWRWRSAEARFDEEPFPAHRPQALATTGDDWLVVLTEGTFAGGMRDAVLVARRPGDAAGLQLLAGPLEMPSQLVARGPWACFAETLTDTATIHCVDPGTRRHLVVPDLPGRVSLFDVAPGSGGHRLVFHHMQYEPAASTAVRAVTLPGPGR